MLYYITKYLSKMALRVNFKNIFFHYQEELPKDKPIIFTANHPTAFLDPVIVGAFLKRQTHFIVRGDIFKGRIVLAILNGLKMLPIFRFRDGYSKLKKNQATMETVYEKLIEKRCLFVLAEGETKHEKRLRPIQKGTARMAFGALEVDKKVDIFIVPVGVNYTDSDAYRSYVMTEVGKAIRLRDYIPVYEENPRKAIKQLTDRIEKEMRGLVIHIEKEEDDVWINRLLEIKRNNFKNSIFPIFSHDLRLGKQEFAAVQKMNALPDTDKSMIKKTLQEYDQKLKKFGLLDLGLAHFGQSIFLSFLGLIIGFIPFLIGLVFNFLPLFFAESLAKSKVKKIEFHSSVRYAAGMFGYAIYWLVLLVISLVIGDIRVVGFIFAIPFLGYYAQIYMEFFRRWNTKRKFNTLKKKDKTELSELREHLLNWL